MRLEVLGSNPRGAAYTQGQAMTSFYRANIVRRLEAIAAELAQLDACAAGGKPNVLTEDGGTTIDHVGYRKSLLAEMEFLENRLKNAAEVEQALNADSDGPFEIMTETDVV